MATLHCRHCNKECFSSLTKANHEPTCWKHPSNKRICASCGEPFFPKHNRTAQQCCSHGCSNTYFRSGTDNGNWKKDKYTTTCFKYHEKKCVCCSEQNIVAVHHFDEDRENNDPRNLIPLCPTHHQYVHSKFKHLVLPKILRYIERFKRKHRYVRFK